MAKLRSHPSNVFEHQADTGRTVEIYLSHEDHADLAAGGVVVLDEARAAFDHHEITTGDGPSEKAVVKITISARDA